MGDFIGDPKNATWLYILAANLILPCIILEGKETYIPIADDQSTLLKGSVL